MTDPNEVLSLSEADAILLCYLITSLERLQPCGRQIHERAQVLMILRFNLEDGRALKPEIVSRAETLLNAA